MGVDGRTFDYAAITSGSIANARDSGAKGDGATDDTAAIQEALTAAGNAGGGVVLLPHGDYLTTGLTVPPWVHLKGVGVGTRLRNTHATNPTVLLGESGSIGWLNLNPTATASRADTAPEIRVGPNGTTSASFGTAWHNGSTIADIWFGRRTGLLTGATVAADEESRVGTCMECQSSQQATKIARIRAFGYFRWLDCAAIDVAITDCPIQDANRAAAQSVRLKDGTEAFAASGCDWVNSQGGSSTAECLLVEAGARFSSFVNCYFDTHQYPVRLTGGNGVRFVGCWTSTVNNGISVDIQAGARNVDLIGHLAYGGTPAYRIAGSSVRAIGCTAIGAGTSAAFDVTAAARAVMLRDCVADNRADGSRYAAGTATAATAYAAGATGRRRDCLLIAANGTTTYQADAES